MPDLVGDHVRLRKVARGFVFSLQFRKKTKIQIDFFIRRAVKRPHLRASRAARARNAVSKKYQARLFVLRAARLKHLAPHVLGLRQHRRDEGDLFLLLWAI